MKTKILLILILVSALLACGMPVITSVLLVDDTRDANNSIRDLPTVTVEPTYQALPDATIGGNKVKDWNIK